MWLEPEGAEAILASQLGDAQLLLMADEAGSDLSAGLLHGYLVFGEEDDGELQQSPCEPTLIEGPGSWSNPEGRLDEATASLGFQGITTTVEQLVVRVITSVDGARLCRVDADMLVIANGGQDFRLAFERATAAAVDVPVQRRTCADILNNDACASAWDNYDGDGDGSYELCPSYAP